MEDHIIRRVLRSAGLTCALVALVGAAPVAADGPTVDIEPGGPLASGTTTITVTGIGFDPAAANGNGIYVVFGPVTPPPAFYLDAGLYGAFKWVSPGGAETPATARLTEDGRFSTTLEVSSAMTTSAGEVDCTSSACAVITFAAHGSTDRSQDTCTSVSFVPGDIASSSPEAAPPTASQVPTTPLGSISPATSMVPVVDDPCALIGGATP
jgi:hypothetical protein